MNKGPTYGRILPSFSAPPALLDTNTRVKGTQHAKPLNLSDSYWSLRLTDKYQLAQLGGKAKIPNSPDEAILERVPNENSDKQFVARFTCPEFTSICPVTGQPDFAHLIIDYIPNAWLLESKSFKLFTASFRNHGAFHEDCTVGVAQRIVDTVEPRWLRIGGYWFPRGGIPIDVFWQTSEPPTGVWVPSHDIPPYRGRF